jgi:hypothetical protein
LWFGNRPETVQINFVPMAATFSSFHRDFLIVSPLGSRVAPFQNPGELSMGNYNSGEFDPGANSRPYPNGVGNYNNEGWSQIYA